MRTGRMKFYMVIMIVPYKPYKRIEYSKTRVAYQDRNILPGKISNNNKIFLNTVESAKVTISENLNTIIDKNSGKCFRRGY